VRIPLTLSRELRRNPVDLLHVQYTAPPFAPCPIVTTVHDLAFEHLPETFNRRSWMQMRLTVRRTARRAAHIITVSDYSRDDIIRTYKIPPERITVTHEAAPSNFAPLKDPAELERIRARYGISRNYVLSLSSIQPRKNLVRLIDAYTQLRRVNPDDTFPQLVLAGKRGWLERETFRAAAQSALSKDILFTGYVPDHDLTGLYSGALCFVYPSYFEGFGLPLVEAMQCGVPLIAGNRTSVPEVVGDAGLTFDPFNTDELAHAIKRLVDNPILCAALRQKGLARAKTFSWQSTARETLRVYEQVGKRSVALIS
jgi:glycosyltransferase involved in cell wall biosynthesis